MEKEIMPIGMNIIVQPYVENPYLQTVTEGGLQIASGEFVNQDSGELDKLKKEILCGKVLEVGSACKEVMVGDDVLYPYTVARPIPFMGKGFILVHEPGLLLIINENLKGRMKWKM